MAIQIFSNNASTTLALALPASGVGSTQVTLASGTGALFPQPGPAVYPAGDTTFFALSLVDAATQAKHEIVYVTARQGDVLTVIRGQDNTTAQQWSAGDIAFHGPIAGTETGQVQVAQLQSGFLTYATATGSPSTINATLSVAGITRLSPGIQIKAAAPNTNSGPVTLNLNGFGAQPVVDGTGQPLAAGALTGGVTYQFVYDGTRWIVSGTNGSARALYVNDQAPASAPNGLIVNTGLSLTALTRGFIVYVRAANTNTSGITLTVDNVPAINALANDGNAVQASVMKAGGTYRFLYDGQNFITDLSNAQSFPIGTVLDFFGNSADIASRFGPGWQIADGSGGTPDLRDRMSVGAGASFTVGQSGGAASVALTTDNLPTHSHAVSQTPHTHHSAFDHTHNVIDGGHSHGVSQAPHSHGVNDPGHSHSLSVRRLPQSGNATQCWSDQVGPNSTFGTNPAGTNISIQSANANIGIVSSTTGIAIQSTHIETDTQGANANITINNAGNGNAFSTRNPFVALLKIIRIS